MTLRNFRLSRISHPRGSTWTTLLLVVAFFGFGMVAEACLTKTDQQAPVVQEIKHQQNVPTQ